VYDSGFKGRDIHIDETRADDVVNSSNNSSFSGARTSLNASMALLSDASTNTSSAQRLDVTANQHIVDEDSAQHMSESSVQESSDHFALNESQMSFSDGEQQHYPYFPDAEALSQVAGAADYSYFEGIEYDEDMELQRALALSLIEGAADVIDVEMQSSEHVTEPAQRCSKSDHAGTSIPCLFVYLFVCLFVFFSNALHVFIAGGRTLLSTYHHRRQ